MDAAPIARLREWLDRPEATAIDPALVRALRVELEGSRAPDAVTASEGRSTTSWFLRVGSHRRRVLEIDRHGTLLATLAWHDASTLTDAALRIPDGSWVVIEPRAMTDSTWGPCDRLWHSTEPNRTTATATPLTIFTSLDYSHVDLIPTLAEPGHLPPGAGTVVLNLIATLARDQNQRPLPYRGPYPTEQLFLALLESFRYTGSPNDPFRAFVDGELVWNPEPHERIFERDRVYVQVRERVEKIIWRGRTYYRPDWQSVVRHAPRRVRDVADGVRCSLAALGVTLEDHLVIDGGGGNPVILPVTPQPEITRPISPAVVAGLAAAVVASSAAPLTSAIRAVGRDLRVEWGPVDHDLVAIDGDRVRFASRLRTAAVQHVASVADRGPRLTVGFALLAEAAALIGDELRARAQAFVSALALTEQTALLNLDVDPADGTAPDIARAAEAILEDLQGAVT